MSKIISQRELRNDNGPILRAVVDAGETFIITRNGVPSAELRPVRKRPTFASRDAFIAGQKFATQRPGRLQELRNDLDSAIDMELEE